MKTIVSLLAAASLFALAPVAHAAVVSLNFDALDGDPGQFEDPLNFYAGGHGSRGSGPGPDFGITFAGGWGVLCEHSDTCVGSLVVGNPSSPNSIVTTSQKSFIDVAGGFSEGLDFSWSSQVTGTIKVWSGLNGTGTLLNTITLPRQPDGRNTGNCGPDGVVCPFVSANLPTLGLGHSLEFDGFSGEAAFDDINFANVNLGVPEPSTWALSILGFGLAGVSLRRRALKIRAAA